MNTETVDCTRPLSQIEKIKEVILRDYPRMGKDDRFCFQCHSRLECFNSCCADVNIFLTPYDVLRMRRALKMGSAEFLGAYTVIPFDENQKLPVPLLKMVDSERKECPFVSEEKGCTIYNDRPWPCRMYPLGVADPNDEIEANSQRFYFLMKDDFCDGLKEPRELSVSEWMDEQQVGPYEEFGALFKEVTLNKAFATGHKLSPQQVDAYWTALYDLDRFHRFVFGSTFLERFELNEKEIEAVRKSDDALLRLGFRWSLMALFGQKVMPIKANPTA